LSAKHGLNDGPDLRRRGAADELHSNIFLHGAEDETKDLLILPPPSCVVGVGDDLLVITGSLGERLLWRLGYAVEMAVQVSTDKVRNYKPTPQHKIVTVETNRASGNSGRNRR
jgi:hypothetical protein